MLKTTFLKGHVDLLKNDPWGKHAWYLGLQKQINWTFLISNILSIGIIISQYILLELIYSLSALLYGYSLFPTWVCPVSKHCNQGTPSRSFLCSIQGCSQVAFRDTVCSGQAGNHRVTTEGAIQHLYRILFNILLMKYHLLYIKYII